MTSPTPTAAPAAALLRATAREHLEGNPVLLQDIGAHLDALYRQATHVRPESLRRVMAIELACVTELLRGFVVVRVDPVGTLALAERALGEVRAVRARGSYAEAVGYAQNALEEVVQDLGGAPMPPLSAS